MCPIRYIRGLTSDVLPWVTQYLIIYIIQTQFFFTKGVISTLVRNTHWGVVLLIQTNSRAQINNKIWYCWCWGKPRWWWRKKSIVVFSLILDPDGPQDTTTENKPLLTSINKQKAPPNPHVGTWHYFLFRGWWCGWTGSTGSTGYGDLPFHPCLALSPTIPK